LKTKNKTFLVSKSKSSLLCTALFLAFFIGTIQSVTAQGTIIIPNVFTPNNDGINDEFKVNLNGSAITNYHLSIYANWGILMFYSGSPNVSWDGRTTSGLKATNGTYYYVLEFNGKNYKGTILLLE
jgi:gliding motility-associated-like protein